MTIEIGVLDLGLVTLREIALGMRARWTAGSWATRPESAARFKRALRHRAIARAMDEHASSDYFFSFQTYRKSASLAVATARAPLWVARLSAERTFSLLSASSARGTLSATPSGT
jgi:hypothetical protein